MLRTLTTILSILICIPLTSSAQLLDKLKKAAQRGAENAIEKKVEEEVEKAATRQVNKHMEKLFGPPSAYEGSDYDYGALMNSMNMDAETADSYSFTGYTDMEITGTDEKGDPIDPVPFRSFSNSGANYWAIKMNNTEDEDTKSVVMIFDQNNDASVMLMETQEGEKSSFAYSMDWSQMMNTAAEESMNDSIGILDVKKTGITREILGYTCDEYVQDNEEISATYWISNEPIEGYFAYWSTDNPMFTEQLKQKYGAYFDELPEGSILEMTTENKEDGSITNMTITAIDSSETVDFVMADYENVMSKKDE